MKIPPEHIVYAATVPFHDCDPLAIVWHGHYYKYLEIARTALLVGCNLDMPDFIELGHRLVMTETRCRHIAPLRYGDQFEVRAWFIDYDLRLHIGYEIRNLTQGGKRAAKAWTTLVATDNEGNMIFGTPNEVRRRIEATYGPA